MSDAPQIETVHHEPLKAPVKDFATDFDHTDPAWVANPYPIWEDLRTRCPVAHTERYGGAWFPATHAGVSAVARDHDHFTSRTVVMGNGRPPQEAPPAPIGVAPPITSDPPFHSFARRLILPAFAPRVVASYEPKIRALCADLADRLAKRVEMQDRHIDAASEYAQFIPPRCYCRNVGLSLTRSREFP